MADDNRERETDDGQDLIAAADRIEDLIDEDGLTTDGSSDDEAADDSDDAADEIREQSRDDGSDDDEADDEAEGPVRLDLDDPETLDALVTLKVGGEDVEMPLREALSGTMRQQDYTRKTQEVAELRKDASAKREEYAQGVQLINQVLGQHMSPEQRAGLDAALQQANAEYAAEQTENLRVIAAREQKVLAESLGWVDAPESEVAETKKALREYAVSQGFQHHELDQAYDHRLLVMLDKARRYDEMTRKGEAIRGKAKRSPVLKPGSTATRTKSASRERKEARKRLSRTGSVSDAATVLEGFLD